MPKNNDASLFGSQSQNGLLNHLTALFFLDMIVGRSINGNDIIIERFNLLLSLDEVQ